jgi:hypothetical protein
MTCEWLDDDFINWVNLLSFNAPFNFLDTTRNRGKSWGIFISAYKRYKRKHRGTILVRRTREAMKKTKHSAYGNKICKFMGIDPATIRINGDYAETVDKAGKWHKFLWFVTLSEHSELRSADNAFFDRMILDEGKVSARKRAMYQGDEVTDLMDLYDSLRRGNRMQLLILGNRESVSSPYMSFFGIPNLSTDFNGVKRFKKKTIVCAQSTKPSAVTSDFDDAVRTALDGTRYAEFAYHGVAKDYDGNHVKKKPSKAFFYCAFDFGTPLALYISDGVYFTMLNDLSRPVWVNRPTTLKNSVLWTARDLTRLPYLKQCVRDNKVFFESPEVAEHGTQLLKMLGFYAK